VSDQPAATGRTIHELDSLLRRYAVEADRLGQAFCERHGMHPTDFQALRLIMEGDQEGRPLTPLELARALSLSSGATSAAIDRLERHGHVRRSRESVDRRRVHLHFTEGGLAVGRDFFGPLGKLTADVRDQFEPTQLQATGRFLAEMIEVIRGYRESLEQGQGED
jgi:DNA-binding MarR family transcriptional regulator